MIVVTGGYKGIGLAAVRELAKSCPGARGKGITVAVRDIRQTGWKQGLEDVSVEELDLACPKSIRALADAIQGDDITLVCNSGVYYKGPAKWAQGGLELHTAVNHVGHALLVDLLAPRMRRLVCVGSGLQRHGSLTDILARGWGEIPGGVSYPDSKLWQVNCLHAWHRAYPHLQLVLCEPGFVPETDLARNAIAWLQWAMKNIMPYAPFTKTLVHAGHVVAVSATDKEMASQMVNVYNSNLERIDPPDPGDVYLVATREAIRRWEKQAE